MLSQSAGEFLSRYIAYVALVVVVAVFGVLAPDRFLTTGNLGIVLQNCAVLCVVAIGITFIIIGGSIDLSVGSVMALSGAVAASCIGSLGAWAFLVAPLVGAGLGAVNGAVFVFGRIPSFVVTLGMLSVARGSTVIFTGGMPVPIPLTSDFYVYGTPPMPFAIAVGVAVVMGALLRFTTFGRYTFAIGGDEEKTRVLGVPVDGVKLAMFVVSGMLAGLGGGILTSQLGSGSPTVGTGFELMAISAVVIGGTPLTGGAGSVLGTVVGSLVITTLANGLIIMGVATNVQTVLTGIVLVGAVMISIRRGKLKIIK
ncbi:ABC transporter permease [Labrys wisconsinensis]|uniref:Ribose/xylose/arabinose/galactoside ABC-type transport system permease subunit n=1 Tax=Labrys wisconsinensis TaxID=425677 RepID=A0ABU0J5N9_9HYPH|nr:ABC transporter permease [Labrys wisconsinensis]MDQ0469549.1 ribose/xylose/arabinose/galactoside ABC-type transport system permease subunit [Labrys wisconsinensis]